MGNIVANTLFYRDKKILRVDEICELDIKFYSSDTPNEKYRIGGKYLTGKVLSIEKVMIGYIFNIDVSKEFYGKQNYFCIDQDYIDKCKAKIIQIKVINNIDDNQIIREIIIPTNEWISTNVYLNNAIIDVSNEKYAYLENDLVIVSLSVPDINSSYNNIEGISRIDNIVNTNKIDDDGKAIFSITFDFSTLYSYNVVNCLSTNIKSIKKYIPPSTDDKYWNGN